MAKEMEKKKNLFKSEFKDGISNGYGIYYFKNGDKYEQFLY